MKVLHLTLNKKWFDMILSGEKKEEYREIKGYWANRFLCKIGLSPQFFGPNFSRKNRMVIPKGYYKQFDFIEFSNGYSPSQPKMVIKCQGIEIKQGIKEWGAEEGVEYFVLKLGEITDTKNCKPKTD